MKKRLRKFLVCINIGVVVSLLISYSAAFINPQVFALPAFFGLMYPIIFIANLFFLILWSVRKKKVVFITFIAMLPGVFFIPQWIQIGFSGNDAEQGKPHIKLISYNVRLFDLYHWTQKSDTRNKIMQFLAREEADIICMQEFYSKKKSANTNLNKIVTVQKARFHHIVYSETKSRVSNFGIATFSYYPIINKGSIRFSNTNNVCIFSDITIENDTIRIYNNHLASVHLGYSNYNFIDSIKYQKVNRKGISGTIDIVRKLKSAYQKRAEQVQQLSGHIQQSPYPVIVCGDFNDTPSSYAYQTMRADLSDAFIEAGNGMGSTYARRFPPFRIDYVLHNKSIETLEYDVPRLKLSDHYPLICRLQL